MTKQQFKQKQHHDACVQERTFTFNDDVFVKNFASAGPNWLSGKITAVKGPVSYDIATTEKWEGGTQTLRSHKNIE